MKNLYDKKTLRELLELLEGEGYEPNLLWKAIWERVLEFEIAITNKNGIIESTNKDMLDLNNQLDSFKNMKKMIIKWGDLLKETNEVQKRD